MCKISESAAANNARHRHCLVSADDVTINFISKQGEVNRMSNNKKIFVIFMLVALVIAGCSAAQAAPPAQQADDKPGEPRTITVNGTGRISVAPDIARIFIGVETTSEEASTAVQDNNGKAAQIMETLEGLGIAPEDIQTTNFSIYPREERDSDGNITQVTYVVQNTVNVTIRDLDQVGSVLDGVVQSGANSISGIQFDLADRSPANENGLEAAVLDARSQAGILAGAAEVELGQVLTINSFNSSPIVPIQRVALEFAGPADVPVSPGEIVITVDITMVFEIQ
jgi:uncharacterized protein YggE